MIFLTVGEQLPFDRLVRAVDEWAEGADEQVIAQIGTTEYVPLHLKYKDFYPPSEYKQLIADCDCIIAHAGMGSIISALEARKPIVVLPRQQCLKEHRNDHQFATSEKFRRYNSIIVASDTTSLLQKLSNIECIKKITPEIPEKNSLAGLLTTIQDFINKVDS